MYSSEWQNLNRYALYVRLSSRRHPIRKADIPGIRLEDIRPMILKVEDTTFSPQHLRRLNKAIEAGVIPQSG